MKILVTTASKHGSTREIGQTIAQELQGMGLNVDLREAGEVSSVAGYDGVVFGSAIYAGNWLPEAKQFAQRHRAELAKVPVWVFSSGPVGDTNSQPPDDPVKLAKSLGEVKPRDHHIFVGKIDMEKLGFVERLITKALKVPEGDFRDWEAIRGWAREIATTLLEESTPVEP